jgi:hypothetical protein
MKLTIEAAVVVFVAFSSAWLVNLYRLTSCDFDTPLRCEVIHAAGVVLPPAAVVTVWFDDDGE